MGIADLEIEPVESDDRRHEAEADSVAVRRYMVRPAMEAPEDRSSLVLRYAGTVIRAAQSGAVIPQGGGAADATARRRELDRVIDEVTDRFHQQVAVGDHGRGRPGLDDQIDPAIVRDRLVEVGRIREQRAKVDRLELGAAFPWTRRKRL